MIFIKVNTGRFFVLFSFIAFLLSEGCTDFAQPRVTQRDLTKNEQVGASGAEKSTMPAQVARTDAQTSSVIVSDGTSSSSPTSSAALAPYLFTLEKARIISPFVQPYIFIDDSACLVPEIIDDVLYNGVRNAIGSYANNTMTDRSLAPGRSFIVDILDSPQINAASCGQRLQINYPTLALLNENEFTAVVCHEMAHAARNDAAGMGDYESNTLKDFSDKLFAYINNHVTCKDLTCDYEHNAKDFKKLQTDAEPYREQYGIYFKTAESTADIIGGAICGKSGMAGTVYVQGLSSAHQTMSNLDAAEGLTSDVLKLADGDVLNDIPKNEMYFFVLGSLLGFETHPKAAERIEQAKRLEQFFVEQAIQSSIYSTFVGSLTKEKNRLKNAASLYLVQKQAQPSHFTVTNTKTGKKIKIPKQKRPL